MRHEIRQAARRLVRSPAFALASVLTLGLAIGANVAIFAVVQRVVLNPLPYPESDRLVEVDHGLQALNVPNGLGVSRGLYLHYRERAHTFQSLAAYNDEAPTLTGAGEPEQLATIRATPSLGDGAAGNGRSRCATARCGRHLRCHVLHRQPAPH